MWNPFKKKLTADQAKLDEIMERVRADVAEHGGFCIIGLNAQGKNNVNAVAYLHKFSKTKTVFTVGQALNMDALGMMIAMAQFSDSQVIERKHSERDLFVSPISREDLLK